MGQVLLDTVDDFANGFITAVEADVLPSTASPRMKNAALTSMASGRAIISKRRGMTVMNGTAITGSPAVLGMFAFRRRSGTTFTQHHLIVSDGGRLDTLSTSGVLANLSTGLTAGTHFPAFATINNLAFLVNSQDAKKTDGTAVYNFGIAPPGTAPTLADAGTSGAHNGTYEARVTFYNGNTGHESSAGPTSGTVTVTNKDISWTAIPTSADTQVTARRLYIRNTTTQQNFYLVTTIADNVTTTFTSDVADTALTVVGPDTDENDQPPTGLVALAAHRSRLFVTDGVDLYYSKEDQVEAFDPDNVEAVNPDDGQRIVALHSAHEVLIVFKQNAMYGLYGDDPQSWVIRLIDPDIGCTSHRSVVTVEGRTYWWSEQGPMVWDGGGPPRSIALDLIAPTISPDVLNYAQLASVCAAPDFIRQRVLFAVPEVGQTRNTVILPFNYRQARWEGTWDPMDVGALGVAEDANGQPWLFLGNYSGQVFKWWDADHDGVGTGTTSGTFTASGTSVTTVTDSGATFDTTGAGLIERKVTILDTNGRPVGTTRPRIISNTGTAFTMASSVTGLTNGATYTYIVGGPDFQVDTYWGAHGYPYHKKRYEFLYVQAKATASTVTVRVDLAFNYDTSAGQTKALTFTSNAPDATWDASIWDSATYGTQATVNKRLRVGRTGRVWRARFRNHYPSQSVSIQRLAMQGERMTTKS